MKRLSEAVVNELVEKQLDQREIKKRKKEKEIDQEKTKVEYSLLMKENAISCINVCNFVSFLN